MILFSINSFAGKNSLTEKTLPILSGLTLLHENFLDSPNAQKCKFSELKSDSGASAMLMERAGAKESICESILIGLGISIAYDRQNQSSVLISLNNINKKRILKAWTDIITESQTTQIGINGETILHFAARFNRINLVRALLTRPTIDTNAVTHIWGQTPLMEAAAMGHASMVKLLLKSPLVEVDKQDFENRTALSYAIHANSMDTVQTLITAGTDPRIKNIYGQTPIEEAARLDHIDIFTILSLEQKRINSPLEGLRNLSIEISDSELLKRIIHRDLRIVRLLLSSGLDINRAWKFNQIQNPETMLLEAFGKISVLPEQRPCHMGQIPAYNFRLFSIAKIHSSVDVIKLFENFNAIENAFIFFEGSSSVFLTNISMYSKKDFKVYTLKNTYPLYYRKFYEQEKDAMSMTNLIFSMKLEFGDNELEYKTKSFLNSNAPIFKGYDSSIPKKYIDNPYYQNPEGTEISRSYTSNGRECILLSHPVSKIETLIRDPKQELTDIVSKIRGGNYGSFKQ